MRTLGVDTSNYATSLAVMDAGKGVVVAKKSFLPVQKGHLGLRQSDAVFQHNKALPQLAEEIFPTGAFTGVEAVGVSTIPRPQQGSYMPCFLAGVSFATAFSAALGVPLFKTSHQEGHATAALYGAGLAVNTPEERLVIHISGGTTELLLCRGYQVEKVLGQSLDLFAGQAIDRLGVRLGFDFPAGEAVSGLAEQCPEDVEPKVTVKEMNCHFSGLQNQCEHLLQEGAAPAYVAKYCLTAVARTAGQMLHNARARYGPLPALCAGGVTASSVVRSYLQQHAENLFFAPPEFSADNAMGVALVAQVLLHKENLPGNRPELV